MNKSFKLVLGIIIFAVFLGGASFFYNYVSKNVQIDEPSHSQEEPDGGAQADKTLAPNFRLQTYDGQEVEFNDYVGKPIVMNFWASWCSPCQMEMPDFEKVYAEYGDDVTFLMINLVGGRETTESAKAFIEEKGFTFPVYFDHESEASYIYGIRSIPTTVFIDKDGYIVTAAGGMISEQQLRSAVAAITQ